MKNTWRPRKELEEIFERTYGPIRKLGEEPPVGRSVKGWKKESPGSSGGIRQIDQRL